MAKRTLGSSRRRIFLLDTNVLMHDPTAIYRFEEHDIFIPMIVLEELDGGKKGTSEAARNARQVSRFLDELMASMSKKQIENGLMLPQSNFGNGGKKPPSGRLFFQTDTMELASLTLPGKGADNAILAHAQALQKEYPRSKVTLVSKDINLRIKAAIIGVHAEDYNSDQTIEDADLLYRGMTELSQNFWDETAHCLKSWTEKGRQYYRVDGSISNDWILNQVVFIPGDKPVDAIVSTKEQDTTVLEVLKDYRNGKGIWGINPRNREQNFALNLLMDPDIDFVTLLGPAGTGKTLLTLAAGLSQTMETDLFSEIIMTRVTIPLGEDIGFLPGTEEEKMEPWMGALMDNLEVLASPKEGGAWGRGATADLVKHRLKIRSLNYMRGRTFLKRYLILDEAQNLTPKQMKALVTRAGPGTKLVCIGNIAQIDTPYLSPTTSGLTYAVNRFRGWKHYAHITLSKGERSRLADHANEVL
jgi:PhoH-like ATPase